MPRIVLIHPQIPPNTGSIARTCASTNTELHLVGPLGFELSDRYLKRAGLDYWQHVKLNYHLDLTQFESFYQQQEGRLLGFSVRGKSCYRDCHFQENDWLLFGSESDGLPPPILTACDQLLYIPMIQPQVRSLNLSVSVAVGLFEALRQLDYLH
ncbi:MAG: tRNA (cytidine(34)-2'-O)-methyltransferase [Cyanobacteria bacterium P01_G01_bin.49]